MNTFMSCTEYESSCYNSYRSKRAHDSLRAHADPAGRCDNDYVELGFPPDTFTVQVMSMGSKSVALRVLLSMHSGCFLWLHASAGVGHFTFFLAMLHLFLFQIDRISLFIKLSATGSHGNVPGSLVNCGMPGVSATCILRFIAHIRPGASCASHTPVTGAQSPCATTTAWSTAEIRSSKAYICCQSCRLVERVQGVIKQKHGTPTQRSTSPAMVTRSRLS